MGINGECVKSFSYNLQMLKCKNKTHNILNITKLPRQIILYAIRNNIIESKLNIFLGSATYSLSSDDYVCMSVCLSVCL